jgi:MoaA/NifB/PqqE/SkfB family radical SAM enzyme
MGHSIPLIASFKVTYHCNLYCRGCPFHFRAQEAGTRIVVFEGGEPFLWRDGVHDINELIYHARELFSTVAVTTNGTFPLDTPADLVWVSLDGLREKHDTLRSDSFDRILGNLQRTGHPRVFIHFTMNRENWRDLEGLLALLGTIPAVQGTTIQLFYPYGQGEAPLALSREERRTALGEAIRLKDTYPIMNSRSSLKAMMENDWVCHDDILINVDPNGEITRGCYVKNRGRINCRDCGFTAVTEASGALDLNTGSLIAGCRVFL